MSDALITYFDSCIAGDTEPHPFPCSLETGEEFEQAELDRLWADYKARKTESKTTPTASNPIDEPVNARIDRALGKQSIEAPKTQKGKGFTLPSAESKRYDTGSVRFDCFNWFADRERRNLTPAACEVWFTLWGHADGTNRVEKVSAERIAVESGLGQTTVDSALTTLVKGGYLERLERGGKGKPTVYRVHSGRNTPQ